MQGRRANNTAQVCHVVIVVLLASGTALAQDREPFQKGTVGVEIGVAPMAEIWNINDRHEEVVEGTVSFWGSINDRVAIGLEFHHAFVFQSTPGAFVQGLSPLVRWKLTRRPFWNAYVEVGPGVSWSDLSTPPRGTKFNYLFQAGGGAMRRVGRSSHVMLAYRFFHLSNNGREGTDHNPDLEMMGAYAGWSFSF